MAQSPVRQSPLRTSLALACVFLFALLVRLPVASMPLERDEGGYAYIGRQWFRGEVPYRHSFDVKPPGVFFVYGLLDRLLGSTPAALHWGAQLYTLATLVLVFFLGRRLVSPTAGFVSALFLALMTVDPSVLGNAANTELFMILPLTASFFCTLAGGDKGSWTLAFLAGLLAASAVLFKQVAVAGFAFSFVVFLIAPRRWRLELALLGGFAVGMLAVLVYFFTVGAGQPFVDCTWLYGFTYAGQTPLSLYHVNFYANFRNIFLAFWPIFFLAYLGARGSLLRRPVEQASRLRRRNVLLLLAWLACCSLGVAAGGYFREHYFIQTFPAVALLAGLGAAGLPAEFPARRWAGFLPLAVCAAAVVYCLLLSPWYYFSFSEVEKCQRLYASNPVPESLAVADFLRDRSQLNDLVFIFGSEPQILYYADRKSPSRFLFMYPLTDPTPDTLARQHELLRELQQRPPEWIVTVFEASSFLASRKTLSESPAELFDGMKSLLERSYRVVAAVPMEGTRPWPVVTGKAVEDRWRAQPMWYDGEGKWGAMVIWARRN